MAGDGPLAITSGASLGPCRHHSANGWLTPVEFDQARLDPSTQIFSPHSEWTGYRDQVRLPRHCHRPWWTLH